MTDRGVTFCVHAHFADRFLSANGQAIRAVIQHVPGEVIVAAPSVTRFDTHGIASVRSIALANLPYIQSLLAALRHARWPLVMWCDASDLLQPENLIRAAQTLQREPDVCAIAGGMANVEQDFTQLLSPAGILMRTQAAMRFVRVHEFGLLAHFETLAQLQRAGLVSPQVEPLSSKKRVSAQDYWRYTVQNGFFELHRPERYSGYLRIYDPVTLDRYLADAEHFLLFWREGEDRGKSSNVARMFAKRTMLYVEAARQALADSEATLALHYFTRALVADGWGDNGRKISQLVPIDVNSLLPRALAEQIAYLRETLVADRILIEDDAATRALAEHLSPDVSWQTPEQMEAVAGDLDFLVFATQKRQDDFQRKMARATRAVVNLERLASCIAGPIKNLLR